MVGTPTHYYRGRTIPCDNETCPACNDGIPWRWHGYVGLFGLSSHRQVLFEFTAKAAEPLTQFALAYGTLRGCQIKAARANTAPNSRVIITTHPADLEKIHIPEPPNLLEALSIIWNIELPAIRVEGINKGNPSLQIAADPDLQKQTTLNRIRSTIAGNQNGNGKTP